MRIRRDDPVPGRSASPSATGTHARGSASRPSTSHTGSILTAGPAAGRASMVKAMPLLYGLSEEMKTAVERELGDPRRDCWRWRRHNWSAC